MAEVRIGTSGWAYQHWREVFYPRGLSPRLWLEHFAREFSTVELNVAYYRLPSESAFTGWRQRSPPGFLFAVKASRIITHLKRLAHAEAEVEHSLSRARLLEDRLGPLLIQTPPRWNVDVPRLRDFAARLPTGLRCAFEFRDPSWFCEEVYAALAERGMAAVRVTSSEYPDPPATAPFHYLRMHGEEPDGSYSRETLCRYSERVLTWAGEGGDVYVYFNNDAHGYAVEH